MKLSELLAAGKPVNMQTALRRAGYQGGMDDGPAIAEFLRAHPMLDVEVPEAPALPVGKKNLRPKQPQFHQKVGDAYGWKCAITGEAAKPVLQAAHLRNYKDGHNEAHDGILLRMDLHKLMDEDPPLLRIVRENGQLIVRVAPEAGPNYGKLDGKKIRLPERIYDRPAL